MSNRNSISLSCLSIILFFITAGFADNPIIQTNYTADPAPMVHNDTVFLYTSHDEDNATGFLMNNWLLYTSTDLVNWTDHGVIASLNSFSWQSGSAWAPQCVERNGKFYLYCPLNSNINGRISIGVLVSNSPYGPFTDPLGKPLITGTNGANDYDPTAFIDDDGQAYLYWGGNGPCMWAKLNSDMISVSGSVQKANIDFTGTPSEASYTEGPWLYKHNKNYYLAWASRCCPEGIGYAMSTSPMGPWKCKGTIMDPNSNSSGNHPGLMDFKGKSYVFGFNYELQIALVGQRVGERRSICIAEMTFNSDSSIKKVPWWGKGAPAPGVAQVSNLNPYDTIQAETICWEKGVRTEKCKDDGAGMDVDSIHNGDYIRVKGVDFGSDGAKSFDARVASATSGGSIEIHIDTLTGPIVGTCAVSGTSGWQTWTTKSCTISNAKGVHDVFFKFTGGNGLLFNFNWWKFNPVASGISNRFAKGIGEGIAIKITSHAGNTRTLQLDFSNPASNEVYNVCLFDLTGKLIKKLYTGPISSNNLLLPISRSVLGTGTYLVSVSKRNTILKTKHLEFD